MVGIVRPFARYIRRCRRRALAMEPTEPIAIFDCFFFSTLLRIAGFGRCQPNRINSIRSHLLQVVRAFPHNANLDSNKTALSITALARIDACDACSL